MECSYGARFDMLCARRHETVELPLRSRQDKALGILHLSVSSRCIAAAAARRERGAARGEHGAGTEGRRRRRRLQRQR